MKKYDHKKIEKKWQKEWKDKKIYKTKDNESLKKQYILDMFPYPSGDGLHVGHPRGYIATDVYSRKKRMEGYNVLHPMGWDAFGLPAENFAIKNKIHPSVAVNKNVARFKEQLSLIGLDYDWSREINTTDPKFYKWTQWIFLEMYKKGLAYESFEPINWCPSCQTGLANEDVESDGTCERCGTKVEKKPMRQWVLKITDYADRMLADLDKLPKWPEGVKEAQRNWIGRSEGSEIEFEIKFDSTDKSGFITVFTTRADTLFGVTYLVLASEHPWVTLAVDDDHKGVLKNTEEVKKYIAKTKNKSELDRQQSKEKTGVELKGVKAINPANKEEIPVWIADYVLSGYGTGAIMAVPAHDERDFEFAEKYNIPIRQVIARSYGEKQKDETYVKGVCAVVYDPDSGQFAMVEWNHGMYGLIAGGLNENENIEDAIKREMLEESGLYDIQSIKHLCFVNAHYYNQAKNTHRDADTDCFLVILNSKAAKKIHKEAHEKFELIWTTPEKILENWNKKNVAHGLDHWIDFLHISLYELKRMKYSIKLLSSKYPTFTEYGKLINSGQFDGLTSEEAKNKITKFVRGKIKSTYRIKDWVFSRQRYWGEPIPIIHCEKCGIVPVPEKDLPVLLPEVKHYEPTGTGESPLANIAEWVNVKCPKCKGEAKRETNTMPQWAGSSWYYLRYIDPNNSKALVDAKKEKHWMSVDVYVGGDHATRHLIYARFWHKFLFDIGVVTTEEPFPRLEFLGFILAEDGRKMSKRWKNVVNPDDVIKQFGADAFRLYEMFIGPFENTVPWSTNGLVGTYRFIEKIWTISQKDFSDETDAALESLLHKTIKKVSEDIENFKFNTAISAFMIFANDAIKNNLSKEDFKKFLQILNPFAPHVAEEIWNQIGEKKSIQFSEWPKWNEKLTKEEKIKIAIQINGKVRTEIMIEVDESEETIKERALQDTEVLKYTSGQEPKRFIYIKNRLINIVV